MWGPTGELICMAMIAQSLLCKRCVFFGVPVGAPTEAQENPMRLTRRAAIAGLLTLSACTAVGLLAGANALAHPTQPTYEPPRRQSLVSVNVESPSGSSFDNYWHRGNKYVAGEWGHRYNIRLTNNTSRRVEVVLSVDGRDVVSGKLGNYRNQRGYIVGPHDSIVVEGYRQSMDRVAAFRFTDSGDSYSSRLGTPQHVGVIGMAVFEEYRRKPRPAPHRPITPRGSYDESEYGGSSKRKGARGGDAAAPNSAPSAESSRGHWREDRQLGTEYGESTYSSVRETSFRRRNKRRPDQTRTIYYDSHDGLRAKGVLVDPPRYHHHDHHHYEPEPFPDRRYAQPPPPRY